MQGESSWAGYSKPMDIRLKKCIGQYECKGQPDPLEVYRPQLADWDYAISPCFVRMQSTFCYATRHSSSACLLFSSLQLL